MSSSSDEFADRVRSGDVSALAQYMQARRPQLLGFIERQLGSSLRRKVEAEDILQEVSAEAVRALPQLELGDRDPFGWLCQVAQRRIIDAHRRFVASGKRAAHREVPLGGPGDDSQRAGLIDLLVNSITTPSKAFSRNVREARLLDALEQLPAEQRDALRMRYVENLPSKQIAEKLNKSDAAVRVMLTRSLRRLQTLLDDETKSV